MNVESLVDTDRWPLDDDALVSRLHATFVDENIVVLPGFIKSSALPSLIAECDALATIAQFESNGQNIVWLSPSQYGYNLMIEDSR